MTGPLRAALGDYLRMRRALGYRLVRPEKLLHQFLDHLEQAGVDTVTVDQALSWARLPADGDVSWWALRLSRCAASPPTCTPSTPRTRCRRPTCSAGGPGASPPTCFPTPTSPR
ncbi:MAG TPA: hypothetical protein VKP64_09005 [Mycobacteriales bacterium]|nr:hypothetical protein [Mycobacteriales bacterium]